MSCRRSQVTASFRAGLEVAGAFLVVALGAAPSAQAGVLEGYPTEMTVVHSGTLELHVRSEISSYHVSIWRQGVTLEKVADERTYAGTAFPIPPAAWEGCDWPVTCRVPVPESWRPGAYLVRVEGGGHFAWIPFVVRAVVPGSHGPILVQLSTNTWQAYNRYGGKSFYGAHAPGLAGRAVRVSFHRPYDHYATDGSGMFFTWEAHFIAFLETRGYAYEVCTQTDLHRDPTLPRFYEMVCSVAHDEYHSKETFDALENYADAGGNLAFFSGNTLWWQVRMEDQEHTLVCYKSANTDPLLGIDDSRVTTNWHLWPVLRPPARLMGTYYNESLGISVGAYQVVDADSWAYRGVQVVPGQSFGYPMVGFEVDAIAADSPPILEVIAHTELLDRSENVMRPADVVYYERTPAFGFAGGRGGKVFSGGSVNWVMGLMPYYNNWMLLRGSADPVARTVTANVLDRLGCDVTPPRLLSPPDTVVAQDSRVLLRWDAARAVRADMAVHYTVYWQSPGSPAESLQTDSRSAWATCSDSLTYTWWVRARAECGATAASWTSFFRVTSNVAARDLAAPSLRLQRDGDRVDVLVWLPRDAAASVDAFDAAGRRRRRLADTAMRAGQTRIEWDLRDARGRRLPSGIYFVRLRSGGFEARARLVLAR